MTVLEAIESKDSDMGEDGDGQDPPSEASWYFMFKKLFINFLLKTLYLYSQFDFKYSMF